MTRSAGLARANRFTWMVPLAGFLATYVVATGISLSNADIRPEAEIAGLIGLAVFPAIGLVLTWRAGTPRVGVIANLLLATLVALLAWLSHASKRPDAAAPAIAPSTIARAAGTPIPVWIDTDPACGFDETTDVDDCWALAFALRSPELQVTGISTVFGNEPADGTLSSARRADLARSIVALAGRDTPVFAGSESAGDTHWPSTAASDALAAALSRSRLTIIALGPATNVATLLARHPDRAARIERIVIVAGKRPGRLFHPGRHWWFHFGDFNVSRDIDAIRSVLRSGVPITLVPFELAIQVTITEKDVDRLREGGKLAGWLADKSERWLAFWQGNLIEGSGFSPFDALAVGHVAVPNLFACRDSRARIGFSVFLAPFGLGRDLEVDDEADGTPVCYCHTVDESFKSVLLERLTDRR